jgi:thiol:disulfide interchange protein DsbD
MIKRFLLLIMAIWVTCSALAQAVNPVSWTYKTKKVSPDEFELTFRARIQNGWHLYNQDPLKDGPMPLVFSFDKNPAVKFLGRVAEKTRPTKVHDEMFGLDVRYFVKEATFVQKVKVLTDKPITVKGSLEGQSCNEGSCVPLEADFSFKITGAVPANPVSEQALAAAADSAKAAPAATATDTAAKGTTISQEELVKAAEPTKAQDRSLLAFFIGAFLAGLAAILTPCVFPMIPMTVSFFMKKDGSKKTEHGKALFFGFSIIFIYTVIGTLVSVIFGADFANFISTHWLPNILFFAIFMVFAFSFFGMFEITLPSWMVNRTDAQVDKGGWGGPFFMALTLVLVSFSCTGPIVGSVLVQSMGGHILLPIVAMLGFSLAFAIPFTVFALSPSLMDKMPKSGGWLNSVKVILGFVEVAFAFKFLSIADQTYHWHLLDREIYLAIWITTFTLMGFYLLGKLKFSHDSDMKHVSVPRLMMALMTFSFVVYMVPGLWGAPLNGLSGYLPPQASQDFDMSRGVASTSASATSDIGKVKYGEFLHLPHGLQGFFDLKEAKAYAQKVGKPIFIDFTGHGCVNCREMEAKVWSDPRVLKLLQEEYVVVALYVDDKTELPQSEWKTSAKGKELKTLGKINADYQISKFNMNAQPYYVLMNATEKPLITPRAYDLNPDSFVEFLNKGIEAYKKN